MKHVPMPFSIRFTDRQRRFLKRLSLKQKHGRISITIKKLVDREMEMHGAA